MPIILGHNTSKGLSPTTSVITRKEFDAWRQKLIELNQVMTIPGVVDLSKEKNIVFFRRETLLGLISSARQPEYTVFHFVCSEQSNKFGGLSVFVCGVNKPYQILTRIYKGHHLPNTTDEFVGRSNLEDLAVLKVGIASKILRDSKIIMQRPVLGFLSDEYDGYAHDNAVIKKWLNGDERIQYIGVCLAVDTREERGPNRTTLVLVGADEKHQLLLPLLLVDDLLYDNGAQCCPIP